MNYYVLLFHKLLIIKFNCGSTFGIEVLQAFLKHKFHQACVPMGEAASVLFNETMPGQTNHTSDG